MVTIEAGDQESNWHLAAIATEHLHFVLRRMSDEDWTALRALMLERITNPMKLTDKFYTWDLKDLPAGVVTLRLTIHSTRDTTAKLKIHLNLQVPTRTPTPTLTPTVTPTGTATPTVTLTPNPTATPTPSLPAPPPLPTMTDTVTPLPKAYP